MRMKQTKPPVWWTWFFGLALGLTTLVLLGQSGSILPSVAWWFAGGIGALFSAGMRPARKSKRRLTSEQPEPLPEGYEIYTRYSDFAARLGNKNGWSAEVLRPKAMGPAPGWSYYFQPPSGGPYHERGVSIGHGKTADEACRAAILQFQRAERLKQRIAGEKEIAQMVWAPDSLIADEDAA